MRSMLEYMAEDDEQYGSRGPSRVEEADTRDPASQSIGITTSPSELFSATSSLKKLSELCTTSDRSPMGLQHFLSIVFLDRTT
ncbi:hypothetical protein F2Q70_00020533 [Brassica cretica]|uniref:Uncharacterized protein n=1 Tax=Brassica cretica TaxID=69181 RepID=A0A8S9H063_BRACR|nr:hypothetical protein F2Q70_00020533 [Brassica cretica]KAF2558961.1 hypothetical protein F2Q68_00014052 [Brassica cretica]